MKFLKRLRPHDRVVDAQYRRLQDDEYSLDGLVYGGRGVYAACLGNLQK